MIVRATSIDVMHDFVVNQEPAYGFLNDKSVLMDVPTPVHDTPLISIRSDHTDVAFAVNKPATSPAAGSFAALRVGLLHCAHSDMVFVRPPHRRVRRAAQHLIAGLTQLLLYGKRLAELLAARALYGLAGLKVMPRFARVAPAAALQGPVFGAPNASSQLPGFHAQFYIGVRRECELNIESWGLIT